MLFLSIGLLMTLGTFVRDYVEGVAISSALSRHSRFATLAACWTCVLHLHELHTCPACAKPLRDLACWHVQMRTQLRRSTCTRPANGAVRL